MRKDGIPETPKELEAMLFYTLITRAYGDLSRAATRKRLTERDIRVVEETVLAFRQDTKAFADEFRTFETEPAVAAAFQKAADFFAAIKADRLEKP